MVLLLYANLKTFFNKLFFHLDALNVFYAKNKAQEKVL